MLIKGTPGLGLAPHLGFGRTASKGLMIFSRSSTTAAIVRSPEGGT